MYNTLEIDNYFNKGLAINYLPKIHKVIAVSSRKFSYYVLSLFLLKE